MAQAVIPYLHSESNPWIFGQNIGFSDSGCFRSTVFRSINTSMAESYGNLRAQACAADFLQYGVRNVWRSQCDRLEGGHMSAAVLAFPKLEFPFLLQTTSTLATLLICFYTHCMLCYVYNYRKLLF